jgi:hypothetical protein
MSCKLFLVPEDVIQSWRAQQRTQKIDRPVETSLDVMDKNMQSILNNRKLNEHDKEKLYSQKLATFVQMRDNRDPGIEQAPVESERRKLPDDIMESVPKLYRTKAMGFLKYLQTDPDIHWDEQGRLVLKGATISKSHIVDLLHDALRYRKKAKRATGWQQLSHHLQEKNIPQELVGNETWATPPSSTTKTRVPTPSVKVKKKATPASFLLTPGKPRKSKLLGKQKIRDWLRVDGF